MPAIGGGRRCCFVLDAFSRRFSPALLLYMISEAVHELPHSIIGPFLRLALYKAACYW